MVIFQVAVDLQVTLLFVFYIVGNIFYLQFYIRNASGSKISIAPR